jgi:acetyl-CoA synthetase
MIAPRDSRSRPAEMSDATTFHHARELLLAHRDDYERAYAEFRWPMLGRFNWALDWFDAHAAGNHRTALWIVDDGRRGTAVVPELSGRSSRANFLRDLAVRHGDRCCLMLPNVAPLWEAILASRRAELFSWREAGGRLTM